MSRQEKPLRPRHTKTTGALLAAALSIGLATSATAAPIGGGEAFFTEVRPGSGREPTLEEILANTGHSLTRVSDSLDIIWNTRAGDGPSVVRARARYAGYNNAFGIIPQEGVLADLYIPLLVPRGPSGWQSAGESWVALDGLVSPDEDFFLALATPVGLWSSNPADNSDGLDHMVTYVDDEDPYHYFVGFEDLRGGGDRDYNDLVIELHQVVDGPVPIPEPGTLTLMGAGLVGLGVLRRRRRRQAS